MKKLLFLVLTFTFITNTSVTLASGGLLAQIAQNLKSTNYNKVKKPLQKKVVAKPRPKPNPLAEIKREITILQKDGRPIGEDHYNRLISKLASLQKQGVNSDQINKLKKILFTLLPKKSAQYTMDSQVHKGDSNSTAQAIKNEIGEIGAKGSFLSEAHYARLKKELDKLTSQGEGGLDRYYAIIEKANPSAIAQADQEQAKKLKIMEEVSKNRGQLPLCNQNDPRPLLIADITDLNQIGQITAPGNPDTPKGLKGHGFIWPKEGQISPEGMPVYLPLDAYGPKKVVCDDENNVSQCQLNFTTVVNPNYRLRFDHLLTKSISNKILVVEKIYTAPKENPTLGELERAMREEEENKQFFKAGELIGYGRNPDAKNWDFGLYNVCEGGYEDKPLAKTDAYGLNQHAVCWLNYLPEERRSFYREKFTGSKKVCNF